jgi:tetratricopeptide (TPR) repeat protein
VRSTLVRGALVATALLAGVWLALGYHAIGLREEGEEVLERVGRAPLQPEQVERARDAFRGARRLSVDQDPVVDEGLLLVAAGRSREAANLARRATEAEPENSRAWFLALAAAANPGRAEEARRRLSDLNPWWRFLLR